MHRTIQTKYSDFFFLSSSFSLKEKNPTGPWELLFLHFDHCSIFSIASAIMILCFNYITGSLVDILAFHLLLPIFLRYAHNTHTDTHRHTLSSQNTLHIYCLEWTTMPHNSAEGFPQLNFQLFFLTSPRPLHPALAYTGLVISWNKPLCLCKCCSSPLFSVSFLNVSFSVELVLAFLIRTHHFAPKLSPLDSSMFRDWHVYTRSSTHPHRCSSLGPNHLAHCQHLKGASTSDGCSVMSDSLRPHGLQPTRLLCPWDSPGKSTGVGCHILLQGIFPTQGSNPGLLHCGRVLYQLNHQGLANKCMTSELKSKLRELGFSPLKTI